MESNVDTLTGVGLAAAPGIIAGVIAILKPNLLHVARLDSKEWLPLVVLALSLGYAIVAWQSGLFEARNPVVALLIGVNVALATVGARELLRNYRDEEIGG